MPQGFWRETVDSTQDEARRLIAAGLIQAGCAYVVAHHQTHSRGTHGRQWVSAPGEGLYLSLIHLPELGQVFDPQLPYTQAAGVGVAQALIHHYPDLALTIKPVNDLMVDEAKLGGILVESDLTPLGLTALITGIGLNLQPGDWQETVEKSGTAAIALAQCTAFDSADVQHGQDALLEAVIAKVCFAYGRLWAGQAAAVLAEWTQWTQPPIQRQNPNHPVQ
jgi:BirA family transcriptional regulator, biotin operon repressor / biotin---[acetyl-CoA-carboxylase] ligase